MKLIYTILLVLLSFSANAMIEQGSDHQYCFGEPNDDEYADVVICFSLNTHTHYNFDDTDAWSISGYAWNRVGGFVPIDGSVITAIDNDGKKIYTISYDANLIQKAQHTPNFGIAIYAVKGIMIIDHEKLPVIVPSADRFNDAYRIGWSYREDIMVNASLFGNPCQTTPTLCWDLQTGFTPKNVVRYSLNDLPFTKPLKGGY